MSLNESCVHQRERGEEKKIEKEKNKKKITHTAQPGKKLRLQISIQIHTNDHETTYQDGPIE